MAEPDYITSDVHLGAAPPGTEERFLAFLRHVGAHGRRLFILGDLFDFWFEYDGVVPGKYFRVLAGLAELVDRGVPVTLLGGNHDAWGGRFLEEEVGVSFHPDALRTELAGRSALLVHGDGRGGGDLRYRMFKAVIRSRPAVLGFSLLPAAFGSRLAGAVSTTHAKAGRQIDPGGRPGSLERWAGTELDRDPSLTYIACGHVHMPAVKELEPGRFYINAGDWLGHDSYVTVAGDGVPRQHRWTERASPAG